MCDIVGSVGPEFSPNVHLQLDVMPLKASLHFLPQQMETCVELRSPFEDCTELVFTFAVDDTIPTNGNSGRLSRMQSRISKQALSFQIINSETREKIRGKRCLKAGTTIVEIDSRGYNYFTVCFINLSFDSSWTAIDTVKNVDIKVTANDFESNPSELARQMKDDTILILQNSAEMLTEIADTDKSTNLITMESYRRDLNEEVFSKLLYSEIIFIIALLASQLLVASYLIKENG